MSYYPGAVTSGSGQVLGPPTAYSTSATISPGTFASVTTGSATVTMTLSSATGVYRIKKADAGSGTINVVGPTGAKFDGQSTWTVSVQYQSNDFTGDGSNYLVT